jgi:tellurite resistance protein TehA-like permease
MNWMSHNNSIQRISFLSAKLYLEAKVHMKFSVGWFCFIFSLSCYIDYVTHLTENVLGRKALDFIALYEFVFIYQIYFYYIYCLLVSYSVNKYG